MNDQELYRKAEQACLEYHRFYGKYPEKVGVEYSRLRTLERTSVNFPLVPSLPVNFDTLPNLEQVKVSFVRIPFEPVAGPAIQRDEVYFSLPEHVQMPDRVMASAFLKELLAFERRKKLWLSGKVRGNTLPDSQNFDGEQ